MTAQERAQAVAENKEYDELVASNQGTSPATLISLAPEEKRWSLTLAFAVDAMRRTGMMPATAAYVLNVLIRSSEGQTISHQPRVFAAWALMNGCGLPRPAAHYVVESIGE